MVLRDGVIPVSNIMVLRDGVIPVSNIMVPIQIDKKAR